MKALLITVLILVCGQTCNTVTRSTILIDNVKPTVWSVRNELRKFGVKHPTIVLAQSRLETGNYKSRLTKTHNNLFGFRTKDGYLKFSHWKESVAYYKRWQDRHYKPTKHSSYYNFLRVIGYAEDPNYITKVKKIAYELN